MKIVIIDNYDSFTYNLYQMLRPLCGNGGVDVFRNDQVSVSELLERKPDGIVLSPGPGHPALETDFGVCTQIIQNRTRLDCPILGVCLGHQGIVHYLGGRIVNAPEIVHGKSSKIELTTIDSPLFKELPQHFEAMRYHSLIAAEDDTFPHCLRVTARESRHGLIMAVEHKTEPIFGVQFHPESIGTPHGERLLENFSALCN